MDKASHPKFKPCDALVAEDFEVYPIWGFDLSLESRVRGADETWVRPYEYRSVPQTSDVLFAAAEVRSGSQPVHRGALSFRFVRGKLKVDGCVLLKPRYCAVSIQLKKTHRPYLEWALGIELVNHFPLNYEAVIEVGKERFPVSGTVPLPGT